MTNEGDVVVDTAFPLCSSRGWSHFGRFYDNRPRTHEVPLVASYCSHDCEYHPPRGGGGL